MKKSIWILIAAVVAIAAIAACWIAFTPSGDDVNGNGDKTSGTNIVKKAMHRDGEKRKDGKKKKGKHLSQSGGVKGENDNTAPDDDDDADNKADDFNPMETMFAHLKPADKTVAMKIQEAMDDDDKDVAYSEALKAISSKSAELRKHAIDALSWCGGTKALPELTKMLMDVDEEVAESALDAVENIMMGMDDALAQFNAASMYMNAYKGNKDARTVFAGVISSSAGELIETAESRKMVMDVVLNMIEAGGEFGELGKETYENITGEDWVSKNDALLWVADPEAYSDSHDYGDGDLTGNGDEPDAVPVSDPNAVDSNVPDPNAAEPNANADPNAVADPNVNANPAPDADLNPEDPNNGNGAIVPGPIE